MRQHIVRALPPDFKAQITGTKQFVLIENSCGFEVDDTVRMIEVRDEGGRKPRPTGEHCILQITYILDNLHSDGVTDGPRNYCILGTKMLT